MSNNSAIDVLRFWRDVEIFNIPSPPDRESKPRNKVAYFQPGQRLPWEQGHRDSLLSSDSEEWSHAVFLGVAEARNWARVLLQAVTPETRLSEGDLQQLNGKGWIAAFVVNGSGQRLADSYVPAGFTLGMRRLLRRQTLDGLHDDIQEQAAAFKERCPEVTAVAVVEPEIEGVQGGDTGGTASDATFTRPLAWDELNEELNLALALFSAVPLDFPLSVVIKSTLRRRRKGNESDKAENDIDFLNSFYLNDLDRLIKVAGSGQSLGKTLNQYLGPCSASDQRQDILTRHGAMVSCITPDKLTLGRWPASSQHHLMLAQQAAVGQISAQLHKNGGLIAVNGPPGTGKTTLLCDVVADIVVQRASALARLDHPWSAFEKKTTVGGMSVYPLLPSIVDGTGIVVTSNNNTAVENITRELPARSKLAKDEHQDAGYFQEVAAQVFAAADIKTQAWGLVAAALGNSDNRRKFANAFFRDYHKEPYTPGQPTDIKTLLETPPADAEQQWRAARQEFLRLRGLVEAQQATFSKVLEALANSALLRQQEAAKQRQIDEGRVRLQQLPAQWQGRLSTADAGLSQCRVRLEQAEDQEQRARLQEQIANDRLQAEQGDSLLPLWDRCLRALGFVTQRCRDWAESSRRLRTARADAAQAWQDAIEQSTRCKQAFIQAQCQLEVSRAGFERERATLENTQAQWQQELRQYEQRRQQLERLVREFKATGAKVPDNEFFKQDAASRHLASVWVNPEFDALRAQLFLAALRLHETTLLASHGKAIANLRAFKKMLMRETPEPVQEHQLSLLWNILFFTVPVVSSTLASFDRLFAGFGRESIGWLLIDEAGQATVQSVAGALWRSQRAVIIGDPLQIEPVMTVPGAIVAELRRRHGVDVKWSPATESAQTLADQTMALGAWIGRPDSQETAVWTGLPLRAHRRCIDPMFKVANDIAYAGQMVQANTHPALINCLLGDSAWLDVQGSSSDGQVVAEEMDFLEAVLLKMRANWPTNGDGKLASVFVISPFRKVAQECGSVFKRVHMSKKDWPVDWGTVHRFQGKEADIVLIVLGSAPGDAGGGSRHWASSKPNLLNVALTRAKARVYVIGSIQDWSACPQFGTLASALRIRRPRRVALDTADSPG
ncbi:DEAD/DEAH box helicase [Pseudomonas protegens]|uniref:DEAD/DEAH box helicase n=1 Tax=Pseudomonas protegens TaxID=380021 RepID=UPI00383AEDC6